MSLSLSAFCWSGRLVGIASTRFGLCSAKILPSYLEICPTVRKEYPFSAYRPQFASLRSLPASESEMSSSVSTDSIYDFTVKDAKGNDVNLGIYRGKVVLIVNVASQCGLTNSNYTGLKELYDKYKSQGFEILAFPCNQFGEQEPGTNEQILEFACTRFKAEYPVFDKINVNGDNAAPLYTFLKKCKGGIMGDSIKWNFTKFLADKDGKVVKRYAPTTSPVSIEDDIKKLMDAGLGET